MVKRLITAFILLCLLVPTYLFAPPECVFLLVLIIGYGMYVESYAITFGEENAWFFGAVPIILQVVLVSGASYLFVGELKTLQDLGVGFFVIYSNLILWLSPVVILLWGVRVFVMMRVSKKVFSPEILYTFQLLDITLFVASLGMTYLLNKVLLFYTMMMVVGIDTLSYIVGSYFGKTKVTKGISPKKTLEGYLAGLVWVFAYGSIVMIPKEMSILALTLFLIMVYILAITGDLLVSYQKRLLNVKDSGKLLPGHGGLLDRFDSWMFVSAFVFYLVIIN